jgi:hypothetical protein
MDSAGTDVDWVVSNGFDLALAFDGGGEPIAVDFENAPGTPRRRQRTRTSTQTSEPDDADAEEDDHPHDGDERFGERRSVLRRDVLEQTRLERYHSPVSFRLFGPTVPAPAFAPSMTSGCVMHELPCHTPASVRPFHVENGL